MNDQNPNRQRISGSDTFEDALYQEAARWQREGLVARIWAKDAKLWTGGDEAKWLGWLDIVAVQQKRLAHFEVLASMAAEEFTDVVILGMGGSSLCAKVLAESFNRPVGGPELHILDSTVPAQITRIEEAVDLRRSLFIVASKSGATIESNLLHHHFFDRVSGQLGERTGEHFIAITDPGSTLEAVAKRHGFRMLIHGLPSIGGRFSALSDFGMVPAAILGLDVRRLLGRAAAMVQECGPASSPANNPGVQLGLALALAGGDGRDKVTLIASPGVKAFGSWLEQLIGESTGKNGRGLILVDGEPVGSPDDYGDDRLFVSLELDSEDAQDLVSPVRALESAGHPIVRIKLRDVYDLGQEFFRWELATAVAGVVLGVNPFDQPDVEMGKVATKTLTDQLESHGSLPVERPCAEGQGLRLFAADAYLVTLQSATDSVDRLMRAHLHSLRSGDYFALLAYLDMNLINAEALSRIRHAVRKVQHVATCLSFGPQYLHSTGQFYKGGPNTGVFLQVTADDTVDLPIPGRAYSFGALNMAQARGDFVVLSELNRRVMRVHLGTDVASGLSRLQRVVHEVLIHGAE